MRVQSISLLLLQLISLNLSVDLNTYYKTYIQGFGYKLEENSVVTDDGYILISVQDNQIILRCTYGS